MLIKKYSHAFVVSDFLRHSREAIKAFNKRNLKFDRVKDDFGQYKWTVVGSFSHTATDYSFYIFHINQLQDFLQHLEFTGITETITTVTEPLYEGRKVEIPILPSVALYDEQKPIAEYLISPGQMKLAEVQTGRGKTLVTLHTLSKLGVVSMLIMRNSFGKKWLNEDIPKTLDISKDEYIMLESSNDFKSLLEQAISGHQPYKVIIVSNGLIRAMLDEAMATNGNMVTYPCHPRDILKTLGVGVLVRDEAHLELELICNMDLFLHVNKTINLSATLQNKQPLIQRVYKMLYPPTERYVGNITKYIAYVDLLYSLEHPRVINYKSWDKGDYSHVLFEQSIMKKPTVLKGYLTMIDRVKTSNFFNKADRHPLEKALVFCRTTDMCAKVANYLAEKHPDFNIKRYTPSDKKGTCTYDEVLLSDLTVTTIKAFGVSFTLPGLSEVLNTDNVDSPNDNLQASGRCRELKGELAHVTPRYSQLVCEDIPKHLTYAKNRKDLFRPYALTQQVFHLRYTLR